MFFPTPHSDHPVLSAIGAIGVVALVAFFVSCAAAFLPARAEAAEIPWKEPSYTLVARDMDLRTALDTFAVAEGLSVVMSDAVQGRFSGDFKDVPAGEFLSRLATVHNFTWYYDGAALYLYAAGEIQTLLLDLQYMKAGEVRQMLRDLGVEDGRFPIRTASNDELILVSGPPRYVAIVAETIAKADKLREMRTFNEVEVRMFPLRHTWADDVSFRAASPESTVSIKGVAGILSEMMDEIASSSHTIDSVAPAPGQQGGSATNPPPPIAAPAFKPVIRSETRLNAVIVRDVKSRMPMYEQLIRQLDVPQKLVEIAVTVVELSREDALDWQLSLSAASQRKDNNFAVGQNAENRFSPEELAGRGLAGTLTHIHSNFNLGVSLTALRETGKARNISRTTLLTVNNLAAQMSDSQSYHARVIGTEVASLQEVSAGTDLQIKPRIISPETEGGTNRVWLSISLSDGGFETVSVDAMPMTRESTLQTQTALQEDSSIMLAGYLRDIEEKAGWGIPFLRDIPFIGWLFGGVSTSTETVQRMFIITPHIIDLDLADADEMENLQATRLRDVTLGEEMEDDAEESDTERRQRQLERKSRSMRREALARERLERRKAEIAHEDEMFRLDRKLEGEELEQDIRDWRRDETEKAAAIERKRLEMLERARAMAAADAMTLEEESLAAAREEEALAARRLEEEREAAERAERAAREAMEKALEEERLAEERKAAERAEKAAKEAAEKALEEERLAAEKAAKELAQREKEEREERERAEKAAQKALEEERRAAEKAAKELAEKQAEERKAAERAEKAAKKAAEKALEEERKATEKAAKELAKKQAEEREAAERAEKAAKKAAEEALEAERKAAEQAARELAEKQAAEQKAAEEAERKAQEERKAAEEAAKAREAASIAMNKAEKATREAAAREAKAFAREREEAQRAAAEALEAERKAAEKAARERAQALAKAQEEERKAAEKALAQAQKAAEMAIEEAEKAAAAAATGERKAAAGQVREAVADQPAAPVPVDAVPDSGRVAVPETDIPEVAAPQRMAAK